MTAKHIQTVRIFSCFFLLSLSLNVYGREAVSVTQADRAFVEAVQQKDQKEFVALLDQQFTWTTSAGKTFDRGDSVSHLSDLGGTDLSGAVTEHREYGDVALVTAVEGRLHIARFWVKRKDGWRILVNHEATLAEKAEAPKSHAEACENPCKTIPFTPKSAAEREIILSWQALETAVTNHDSAGWAPHIADEFLLINSNNDHVLTKVDRMAILDKQKQSGAGSAPVPLISAEMFDFGDAAIMRAQHQRNDDKPIHVSRIWIKRDGRWIMAFSEQTVMQ